MADMFRKFLNSFRKNPDIWFFYAFLITSTLSVRKVLFYYPINNTFNEYTGIYLYLSDIFLFLTLITWLLTLCNKKNILSMFNSVSSFIKIVPPQYKCSTWNILRGTRGTIWWQKKAYQQVIHNYVLIFPLFIAFFSFLSILWSNNLQIGIFKSFKLFEFALLFLYVYKLFHVEQFHQNKLFIKRIFRIIIGIGLIQSIIGISQFLIQQSIGINWLKESVISPNIPGVAKIIFDGHAYIRAHGLFPHPNIFGGFLVFSVLISVLYFKLFHVEQFPSFAQYLKTCAKSLRNIANVPRGTIIPIAIILVQGLALLLTFSKSAIIGLFIGFFYLVIIKCSTLTQMFHVEHSTGQAWNIFSILKKRSFYKKLLLVVGILTIALFILRPDTYSILFKSLQERTFYLNVSRGTFLSHPLIGIGAGQFVLSMQDINNIQPWQFQPVHNVFLLILNEFGIVVFFMFLYFIYKLFHPSTNVPRGTFYGAGVEQFITKNAIYIYFKAILLSFTFIMLFDHYLWDIQQGQIMLWVLLGIIVGANRKE